MRGASYDYVVVGAGSAGCAVAARLSEDPTTRVLLLEAGPRDRAKEIRIPAAFSKLFKSRLDWGFETAPQEGLDGRGVFVPRGRTLGGSSAINAQMWIPGHPDDYEDWPEGWGWEDVKPWFERIERGPGSISAQRDPNPMSRAFVESATEATGTPASNLSLERLEGAGLAPVTQRRGFRYTAADAYLKPARRRANLVVETGAHALAVSVEGSRATGIRYRQAGTETLAIAERETILSAGAIGSPQLLMLSGIGPAEHLRAQGIGPILDLPPVGRGLRDHPMAITLFDASGSDSLLSAESPRQLARLLLRRRGMLTSNVGEAAAFLRTRPELNAPDLELLFAPVLYLDEGLTPPSSHGFSIGCAALQPRSRGTVTLRSADPAEPPEIQPNCLSDPDDVRVVVEGVKLARRIARAEPLARWLRDERAPGEAARGDEEIERWVRANAQTVYHPAGTCRMGTGEEAVVDSRLRVRGMSGLRVVDASVMPNLNRGHPHAPITMLAERAAQMIASDGAVDAAKPRPSPG